MTPGRDTTVAATSPWLVKPIVFGHPMRGNQRRKYNRKLGTMYPVNYLGNCMARYDTPEKG